MFVRDFLGPEMAAPILWTPGKNAFFLQENLHVHKSPRFGGRGEGDFGFFLGGGGCRFYFYGRGDFLKNGGLSLRGLAVMTECSGAGNGCANFMDTWKKCLLSAPSSAELEVPKRWTRILTFGPAPLQKIVGDFCCINFGGFCRGFSWRIFLGTFSHKNEGKKSGDKIRRLKNKNPLKIRSAKNRPQ